MGYALFAQQKLVLDGLVNSVGLQQKQRSDEQYRLATNTLSLQSQLSNIQASQSQELELLYAELSTAADSSAREDVQRRIHTKQAGFDAELASINNKINQVSLKENAVEMEVKRLDTKLTALQKQLEAVEEAEKDGIDKATPKFNGVG